MKPGDSAKTFKKFAQANGVDLLRCTPRQGIDQMLAFFREVKPVGCADDGDMLLFQFGTYDWGQGLWFELDITRQFADLEHVYEDEDDDDDDESGGDDGYRQAALSQLNLTWRFRPTPELDAIEAENCWLDRPASEARFLQFVEDSLALTTLGDRVAVSVDLDHEMV